ncbi:MAG TPA: DUF4238 domain-containing protein [Anaerohalosphaeraceae bacterium]|nr:DUF4238 domain-containing protein [Anaerohalosphaeraceae bacterium]
MRLKKKVRDEKKNQHFVPRSFLRNFTIDSSSLIWGYDKKLSKCTGKRSINRICSSNYYYEQLMPNGEKSQLLEDQFQSIEKPASEIIRNIAVSKNLPSHEKGCLALYIGLLLTRGPSFRNGIHEFHKHIAEITLQKEYESGRLPELPAILEKHIVNKDITSVMTAEILPQVSLSYMVNLAITIGISLCKKKWDIYLVENNEVLVTSDTPVMFESISPKENQCIGPAHPESLVLCPITKTMLIAIRPYHKCDCSSFEVMSLKCGIASKLNEMMCFNAQRFVYASEQSHELLGYIKKTRRYSKKSKSWRLGDAIISQWGIYIEPFD